METIIKKAGVLVEAIPYIHDFRQKLFVIKFGGSILDNDAIRHNVLRDIVFLSYVGIHTILVHGGGPHISNRVKEKGLKSEFHDGIRITDSDTLKIVVEELTKLNDKIVKEIKKLKGDVVSVKGDDDIIVVKKRESSRDLGFVGSITSINTEALRRDLKKGHIAVVSPMGRSDDKQLYNINADEVASGIAHSMDAEKLVLLTNVQGVLRNIEDPDSLISTLTVKDVEELKEKGIIKGGMIPKVDACLHAIDAGVKKTHIIDARIQHALLLEFFTDTGVGTQIIKS